MKSQKFNMNRRSLLKGAAGAGVLASMSPLSRLLADAPSDHRFVLAYFLGGWDVLTGVDPRVHNTSEIDLGFDRLPASAAPFTANAGSTSTTLGGVMSGLQPHLDKCLIFRGINMDTLTHQVGQTYMFTGARPAGASPRRDSLEVVMATLGPLDGEGPILPTAAIAMNSYNLSMPSNASATRLNTSGDIIPLISTFDRKLPEHLETLLDQAQSQPVTCIGDQYRQSPAGEKQLSRERLKRLQKEQAVSRLDLAADTAEMQAVRQRFGFTPQTLTADPGNPALNAALATQLLRTGFSRSVTVRMTNNLDTHGPEWATQQPSFQRQGFNSLSAMLSFLREDDPDMVRTTVIVVSEFSRTPKINGSGGRDHHLTNSMVVFSGRMMPGVYGQTDPNTLGLLRFNLDNFQVNPGGQTLQPEHIAATILVSVGLEGVAADSFRVSPLRQLVNTSLV